MRKSKRERNKKTTRDKRMYCLRTLILVRLIRSRELRTKRHRTEEKKNVRWGTNSKETDENRNKKIKKKKRSQQSDAVVFLSFRYFFHFKFRDTLYLTT